MRIVVAEHSRPSDELRRIALGAGLTCDVGDSVTFEALPARLAEVQADLVLIACQGPVDQWSGAIRTAHQTTAAPIVAVGETADAHLAREALHSGAREFLDRDRLRDELSQAISKIEAADQLPDSRGTIVALFSPSGGAGVSTTAINLAIRLGRKSPNQIALVDLKPVPSDLALLLDIEPKFTLNDIIRQWERLDRRLLSASMTAHRSGVHVLPQAGFPAGGQIPQNHLSPQAARQVITLLRRCYEVTVLDLDHTLSAENIEAMRLANFIGLVARGDVPGLRRARWALDAADSLGVVRERFRLVLARTGGGGQIAPAKAEEILGIKVFQAIPEDRGTVCRSVNRGIPLVESSRLSRISRSFNSFARQVRTSDKKASV